jgi:hypothetical protein
MKTPTLAALAAAVLLAACGGATTDDTAAADAAPSAVSSEVQHAAAIANAITDAPTKADSILAAHGVTAVELEAMMYRIARDSVASAAYGRLTVR